MLGLFALDSTAQSVGGGRNEARFGVDGDVTADTLYFGSGAPGATNASDDWFVYPAVKKAKGGVGIIDTNGAAYFKSLLQSSATYRENLRFTRGMSMPKLSRSGGYVMLDALYARDFQNNDKTHIDGTGGVKLIDDPSTWSIISGSMSGKTDITEFYSHVRRKGLTVNDSLFFYFGVGVYATGGSKNIVSELFVNDVTYDTVANQFVNLGSQGGRKAWRFDAAGNVKVIGDMIVSMTYNPGPGTFTLEPQIWMQRSAYDSFRNVTPLFLNPVNFTLGAGNFQSAGSSAYGYVHIEPNGGASTVVAQGRSNDLGTTSAAPWGNSVTSGYTWSANYNSNQFIELSINLTRLGVDPALFSGIDPCTIPYRSIIFYSQASASATSAPQDFAGPYPFWRYPEVKNILSGSGNLDCTKSTLTFKADSANSLAWYHWSTIGGNFTSFNADSTQVTIDQPGTYIMGSAPLQGCFTENDTVVVGRDTTAPYVKAWVTDFILDGSYWTITAHGGDTVISSQLLNATASQFGPANPGGNGHIIEWTGPNGFTSSNLNPTVGAVGNFNSGGIYNLKITAKRNGCFKQDTVFIIQLPVSLMNFDCRPDNNGIKLRWTATDEQGLAYYEIQREKEGKFSMLGKIAASADPFAQHSYSFRDEKPANGWNTYRLAMHMQNGKVEYSDICMSAYNNGEMSGLQLNLLPNPASTVVAFPVTASEEFPVISYNMKSITGSVVQQGNIAPGTGMALIDVSRLLDGVYMLTVEMNGQLYTEKLIIRK